jgi:hypothetical protein
LTKFLVTLIGPFWVHFETFGHTWKFCSMTTFWMACWKYFFETFLKEFIKP